MLVTCLSLPRHPAGEVVHALRLAVLHLPVRHDAAVVQAPGVAAVAGVHIIRYLQCREAMKDGERRRGKEAGRTRAGAARSPSPTPVLLAAAACLWVQQPPRHRRY
jgi:hypothetical protein